MLKKKKTYTGRDLPPPQIVLRIVRLAENMILLILKSRGLVKPIAPFVTLFEVDVRPNIRVRCDERVWADARNGRVFLGDFFVPNIRRHGRQLQAMWDLGEAHPGWSLECAESIVHVQHSGDVGDGQAGEDKPSLLVKSVDDGHWSERTWGPRSFSKLKC